MARWLEEIRWNSDGLVPAIAQDADSGDVLMLAWMSRESLARTLREGEAVDVRLHPHRPRCCRQRVRSLSGSLRHHARTPGGAGYRGGL